MNWFRTTMLLTILTAILLIVGQALGGKSGMIIALVFAVVMNFGSYWFSDKIVLRMYRAKQVGPNEHPEFYQIVKGLALRAGLPMPKVYIVEDPSPNAFATGRNPSHAAVAATTGILRLLTRDELEGVFSHELAHVYNRDTLTGAIAATVAGAIAMIANLAQWALIFGFGGEEDEGAGGLIGTILMIIIAPIVATMIQLAISRSREYAADKKGAKISCKPLALASALRKLETVSKQVPMVAAQANPSTTHLFIVNPLSGKNFKSLFATHPPIEERIRRLEELAASRS